ncbi:hypothetical protein RRG08_006397 [Elysia crispata]|uniref:LIM zinc-binding domain-containing protein n=1 Tax=Elysia crispata TaxID=231223 RepID=A0AAE0Y2S8_9GAST|nr:hypothetical protein RRG08_006397 [Elysia crispata]
MWPVSINIREGRRYRYDRCIVWHKFCFKCEACGMTLNMKNYKGYDKLPYCNAHYPTTKHTVVADTPEARRIAENTKIQSNAREITSVCPTSSRDVEVFLYR